MWRLIIQAPIDLLSELVQNIKIYLQKTMYKARKIKCDWFI